MVLIKDARREFLDKIKHKRVLVFVYLDVDGLCAWKILQHLLKCEEILHTIVPIENKSSLEEYYSKHKQAADNVILINCGATINLVETLKPTDDVVFYVIDSWRPFEVKNVFNGVQVKILVAQDDLETENQRIPEFDDLFEDENEEEKSDQDDDDEGNESEDDQDDEEEEEDEACEERGRDRKRQRLEQEVTKKKKIVNKREWQEKRNKILFEYYKYIYHGCSASLVLFDLAWKVAKDNNDLLWWAIVGLTEQLVNSKIDKELYLRYKMNLDSHVMRLNHRPTNPLANNSNQAQTTNDDLSINCLKISTMDDLNMCLYRHWSVMESINHSIDLACLFKVWQAKGKKKLNEFLADLGLPLNECKQKFSFMDSSHKNDFVSLVASENIKEKYKYDESLIYVSTYIASFGYCNKYSAFDMSYAVEALISNDDSSKSVSDRFIDGLNCLSRENLKAFEVGLEMAKNHLKKMFIQLQNFIDMNQVVASGSFLQVFIDEINSSYFAQAITSKKIARYALQAYLALTKGKRVRNMPLVLCVRLNDEYSLITGIPPYKASNNTENCFGLAFDEAAESSNSRVTFNSFDTSIIEINNEDKSKFLDALVVVMQ